MATLLEQIKQRSLELRKEIGGSTRNVDDLVIQRDLLVTLAAEAAMVGKNDGNRETTDAETVAIIKKFIANLDVTLNVLNDMRSRKAEMSTAAINGIDGVILKSTVERSTLVGFLPAQLNEEQLMEIVKAIVKGANLAGPKSMGLVMKELKERYSGQYDGAMASKVVKQVLGS